VFEVPAGHEVTLHRASIEPGVVRSPGGVVLAHFGGAGDEPDHELDAMLRVLAERMRGDVAPAFLVNAETAITVEDLCAPAEPPSTRLESPVLWIFHYGGAAQLCADPRRLDLITERMRALKAQQVFQVVYVVGALARSHASFIERVRDLGIGLRHPDVSDRQHVVLVEVQRPGGTTLSALAGTPDDGATLAPDEPLVAFRSPCLAPLVLDLKRDPDTTEIVRVLKARTLPLLLIGDPKTGGVSFRQFGDTVVIPAFSDLPALQRSAAAIGLAAGSYRVAQMDARMLFELAESKNVSVAICAFRENTQVWAVLPSLD
jgi:hypothetical protein